MNKTVKVILIVCGSLLVLCACATTALFASGLWTVGKAIQWADTSTTENPQEVAEIASEIADFDLPEGFGSPYGMRFASFTSVGYFSQSSHTHILLTQLPKGTHMNVEEIMRMIQNGAGEPESPWYGNEMTIIQQRPVTICSQESTLSIEEGNSSEGEPLRMATVTFQSKAGKQAILVVSGPSTEWDSDMVEEFIASFQ